jgi:putative membrane protein
MNQSPAASRSFAPVLVLGLILAFYICARILEVVSSPVSRTAIVALDVLSAVAFALTDGAQHYRLRGILVFACICTVVGNLVENLGVTTGFPFGRYYFVELMGPKLFHVPVLLGLAYIGMAYVSWALARLIMGRTDAPITGTRIVTLPLLASAIMTGPGAGSGLGYSAARLGLARRRAVVWRACLQLPRLVRQPLRHLSAFRTLPAW